MPKIVDVDALVREIMANPEHFRDNPDALDAIARRYTPAQQNAIAASIKRLREKALGRKRPEIPHTPGDFAVEFSEKSTVCRPFFHAKHLDLLSEKLAKTYRKGGYLLVSMPPGSGKSTLISVWLPLWILAQDPTKLCGLVSHTDTLAGEWGYKVRQLVIEFAGDLALKLDTTQSPRDNWRLTTGGGVVAEGIGGGLLGKRLNALVIDDPVKDAEAANSVIQRDHLRQWWEMVGMGRLEPGACVVVVGHRWHADDIIGMLAKQSLSGEGIPFDIINLPALIECEEDERNDALGRARGEALWPERYPREALLLRKGGMLEYNWLAQYQGRPTSEGGNRIKRHWWKFYKPSEMPLDWDEQLQSWDLSSKGKKTSDPDVGQVWGRTGALCYLLAQARGNYPFPEKIEKVRAFYKRYPLARLKLVEEKAAGPMLVQAMQREVPGMLPVNVTESKMSRLEACAGAIESGNVLLPCNEDGSIPKWVQEYIEEFAQFRGENGDTDDQIDSTTLALNRMLRAVWGAVDRDHRSAHLEGTKPLTYAQSFKKQFWDSHKEEMKAYEETAAGERMGASDPYFGEW